MCQSIMDRIVSFGEDYSMEKTLCFVIEYKELYLEKVLVEYERIPILFLCQAVDGWYLCLCYDVDNIKYYVVRISAEEISFLLQGKVPMRDVFLAQNGYWDILAGREMDQDIVEEKAIESIDRDVLPYEGAYYEAPLEF